MSLIDDRIIFETKVNQLLTKRKMMPGKKSKVIVKSFYEHFRAQAWYWHCVHRDGDQMLDVLLDDTKLIGSEQFNVNFYTDIFQQQDLLSNKTWQSLMPSLITFKGERIGAGEFFFPFVVEGWEFQKDGGTSDGYVAGGKREIKFGGASLKPMSNAAHRAIDNLVTTVFDGNRPGPAKETKKTNGQSFDRWVTWLNEQPNKEQKLLDFFTQLYPEQDVKPMCKELAEVQTCKKFYSIVGSNVLKWYKVIDGWDSLVIIDLKKMKVANISDVNNTGMFKNLKYDWVTKRGNNKGSGSGDVRQLADGYVNIKI